MAYDDIVKHWYEGTEDAWDTAQQLVKSKKYHFALFFLHLTIEKALKGFYLEKFKEPAPYVHNLVRLAKDSGINLSEDEAKELEEISTFNIAARYDDYKLRLYKKATKEFTDKWMETGKKLKQKILVERKK